MIDAASQPEATLTPLPAGHAERGGIAAITTLGILARAVAMRQPMRYDESVTWAYFVGRSWNTIVTSYPFPNNHVFHSLLAKGTSSLAPFQPWALRLPAFIAGVAIIPLTWAVGRRYATPTIGLLAAALAAGSTSLILYSTTARGYAIVAALFLVLLLLADRLLIDARPTTTMLFAIVGALGLYTIPVMLYPLGVATLWVVLGALRMDRQETTRRAVPVVLAAAIAVLLAGALYLPIIRHAGLGALIGNRFVTPSPWPVFLAGLPAHVIDVVLTWTSPLPWWSALLVLSIALAGLGRRVPSNRPSLALASLLWCGTMLIMTHRVPFVRVWLFALPLFLLSVARGVVRLAARWRVVSEREAVPVAIGLGLVICALAVLARTAEQSDDTGVFRSAQAVTDRLAPELRAGDRVLAPIPTNGPLLYYFSAARLDTALLNTPPATTRRAFLVLDPSQGQSLEWAVQRGIVDPRFFAEPSRLLALPDAELWLTVRR